MLARAARDSFVKLDPRKLLANPVIFATWVVALLASFSTALAIAQGGAWGFALQIALWLWATVLFANFAESVAAYRYMPELLAARAPNRYAFLRDTVFLGAEYADEAGCRPSLEPRMTIASQAPRVSGR